MLLPRVYYAARNTGKSRFEKPQFVVFDLRNINAVNLKNTSKKMSYIGEFES